MRDGVEGVLAADDNQLIDALVRISLDDELRGRIAAHNRDVAPEQDWSHVLPLVERLYAAAALASQVLGRLPARVTTPGTGDTGR